MSNQIPNPKAKYGIHIAISIFILLAVLAIGGFFVYKYYFSQKNEKTAEVSEEKNYFKISDEAAGVFFKVGKRFKRMSAERLRLQNPSFIYGFWAEDDNEVNCFVSQTERKEGGNIVLSKLRDGILEKLKETNPDVKLDEAEIIEIGKDENNKGAKLKMSYSGEKDGKKIGYVQWETAGITEKSTVFAFCSAPQAVIELYRDDLDLFLDSVKIR